MHISPISIPSYGILPQTSKYGKGLLVMKSKPGNLSQLEKEDEIIQKKKVQINMICHNLLVS